MQFSPDTVTSAPGVLMQANSDLFLWRGDGIVLVGTRADDGWSLCRGWITADALTDVRRWRFASPLGFQAQVRRLCRDATSRADLANLAFDGAGRWVAAQQTA